MCDIRIKAVGGNNSDVVEWVSSHDGEDSLDRLICEQLDGRWTRFRLDCETGEG